MSGPELFDEGTGDEHVDTSMDSHSESESDLDSPPACTSMTVRNFFSKKRQRCTSTPSDHNEFEEHTQRGTSGSGIDRVSDSKRKRSADAQSVTPNRPASGRSRVTHGTLRSSQSKGDENITPREATELNTSASSGASSSTPDDDCSVKTALKEITSLLNTVVKRVERVETELKKQSSVSSSSDSTPCSKKTTAVPLIVRVG